MPGETQHGGVVAVQHPNNAVHHGDAFRAFHRESNLGPGGTAYLQIQTLGQRTHLLRTQLYAEAGTVTTSLLEGPSAITDGTTSVTIANADRTSSATLTANIFSDPSAITEGDTEIHQSYLPNVAQTGQGRPGGVEVVPIEWVLKNNTDYLYKTVNDGGATLSVHTEFLVYEQTD